MMYNVPQFIDVEDKIAGPLTWRQLLWMIGMGAVILLIFVFFDGAIVFVLSLPIVIFFVLLAFYRPNGQPFVSYLGNAFFFLFRPKIMMWDRPVGGAVRKAPAARQEEPQRTRTKAVTLEEIRRVAKIVDQR